MLLRGNAPLEEGSASDAPGQLSHINKVVRIDRYGCRPLETGPSLNELTIERKDLDALVLAVTNYDALVRCDNHVMRHIELTGAGTRFTPRCR